MENENKGTPENIPQEKERKVTPINQSFSDNISFEKNEARKLSWWDIIFSKLNKNKKLIATIIVVVGLLVIIAIGVYFSLEKIQSPLGGDKSQLQEDIIKQKNTSTIQPSQEEYEKQAPLSTPTPLLIEFGLYGMDYSDGIGINYTTSIQISLYKEDGTLVSKKTSPATIESNRMPSALFYVPPGKYRFQGETANLTGKGEKTIPSNKGPQYWPIYMYIKPSMITGRLFVDKNNNSIYDSGDEVLGNKPINAYYFTSKGKALEANSTTTNPLGNFSLTLDKYSGTYQLQTDLNLPYMYPKWPQIQVGSGQQLTQNIYLLPR